MKKLFGVLLAIVILLSSLFLPVYAENIVDKDDSRVDIGDIFGNSYKITFNNEGNITESEFLESETIIYPALEASREYDVLWSLSSDEYIVPYTEMPKENVTVYAFKNPVISFENYPLGLTDNSTAIEISTDYALEGGKSFKYSNVDSSNSLVNSIALGKLTSGTAYKISFKYYVSESLKTDHYIVPYTGSLNLTEAGNDQTGKRMEYAASQFNISSSTETGNWIDGEIYFTADRLAIGDFNNIYLKLCSNDLNRGDSIYFDTICVEEMVTADFLLPDGFNVTSRNGILSNNVFTAYYSKNSALTPPEAFKTEGTTVVWVDEDGLVATEFKANGIYRVKLDIKGDLNLDGAVTTLDLALMKLYIVEKIDISEINFNNGDIDSNGSIDLVDMAYLKLHLAGIIKSF